MRLILLGAPGSGKGTIASDLILELQIPHISTGDIFRQNIKARTSLGRKAEPIILKGELVSDEITIAMVADRLAEDDCLNGFLLDGFPRTLPQAKALDKILAVNKIPLDAVLFLKVSDELIISRLAGRRVCNQCGQTYNQDFARPITKGVCDKCGGELYRRDDDKPETIRRRLDHYYRETMPVMEYYKNQDLIKVIDNSGEPGSSLPATLSVLSTK